MSYFDEAYGSVRLTIAGDNRPGLRRAQLGAVHAIGAYFSLPQAQPGLIVMPTGSGKTAVILIAPLLLRARRALILTPSQLVRTQIAEQAASLAVLKAVGVLPSDFATPKVKEVKQRIDSAEAWKELEGFDFVVATPQCVSPGIEDVKEPPPGLFDLILMDEAHHSEAPRWADILEHFSDTKRLLFTATPFRRDRRELKGRVVYTYPLRLAYEDGIFGKLRFIPVAPLDGASHDAAIARKAEEVYQEDKLAGFNHRLMVRTDSKKRADELAEIYRHETKLRLAVVHSGHALRTIRKTLERLKADELDGIICVAMMGEGFDFPELKIAAIHTPHKSLAVTLQFIGRFARTTGEKLGEAKFIAVPQDNRSEIDELYRETAAWQDIVANLSAARIEREIRIKQVAGSFAPLQYAEGESADVVLTDFKPFFHVKIYQLDRTPDLTGLPEFPDDISVLRHEISEEHNTTILLLRQVTRPRWTDHPQFSRVEHDLVVIYFDQASNLLFINSSRRSLSFYKLMEDFYGKGLASLLSGPRINRVIADLHDPDFFSIGLKNLVQNSNTESYQIKSGPSAQNAISPTDGLMYQRGHLMGKGADDEGKRVTIGYSSSSKVWSNYSARIGELIEWCQALAAKLQKQGVVMTGTPLDVLEVGEELEKLPIGVIGVGWPDRVFKEDPRVRIELNGTTTECPLLDCEVTLQQEKTKDDCWVVRLAHDCGAALTIRYRIIDSRPSLETVDAQCDINVIREDEDVPLLTYLSHFPLAFFLEDFSRVDGATLHRYHGGGAGISADHLRSLPWEMHRIAIDVECTDEGLDLQTPKTVQDYLGVHLVQSAAEIVFFDHGSGEMADYITLAPQNDNRVVVELYHCKGAGGKNPGDRVSDAYEVCGQVSKCLIWLKNKQELRAKVLDREQKRSGKSRFLKGSRNDLLRVLDDDTPIKLEFAIHVVQPGIMINKISDKIGRVLGAASHYVQRAAGAKMYVIGSS